VGAEQVGKAGATMQEIMASVQRVTNIMGEISSASAAQTAGIEQMGGAMQQLDQATQQNAALVEEASAAAHSLREHAQELQAAVGNFKLGEVRLARAA
jgi:methyl-accepting chemotaxis protein